MKNWIITTGLCLIVLLFSAKNLTAANCTAIVNNGNWTSGASWSCGHQPTTGDIVIIPAGITILITTNMSGNSDVLQLYISGTLEFNSGKIGFGAGSGITINSGGQIINTGGGGNSSNIVIDGTTWWKASDGTVGGPSTMGTPTPLPVELVYFTAHVGENEVELRWQTAQEINNDYFEIERSSDGISYTVIGKVKGSGTTNQTTAYSFTDNNPVSGITYYRLKQTDTDRQFSTSDAVAVNVAAKELSLTVAPNPVTDGNFTISASAGNSGNAVLGIYDMQGSELFSQALNENNTITITDNNLKLESGVYIVRIKEQDAVSHQKIIVQ